MLTDLLILQLHVPGLNDEALEGGVVRRAELQPDPLPRPHVVRAQSELGRGGRALRRVRMAGCDGWAGITQTLLLFYFSFFS